MQKESLVIAFLAKTASELINDLACKHEDGEFLPEITSKNPHLYKRKQELLELYCDSVIQIFNTFKTYHKCKKEAKIEMQKLLNNLRFIKNLENHLYFDCHFIEIGGDH